MGSVVVGLGKTGASCVRYLVKHGVSVSVTDSRSDPPGLGEIGNLARTLDLRLGGFDLSLLNGASQVLMSPGVSLAEPIAIEARTRGIEVVGDVELFARAVRAPVIGITGTNGKSTVTSLVATMANASGRRVLAGGNLGKPALDLLDQPLPDLYVLELSSFQLETTESLDLLAAAVLNISADHMDRYATIEEYARAKARILARASTRVLNADDPLVAAMRTPTTGTLTTDTAAGMPTTGTAATRVKPAHAITFSTQRRDADYGLSTHEGHMWLARHGTPLLDTARMKIHGLHNAANALAALALGEAAGLPLPGMLDALEAFPGLPHRSAWVADIGGVRYVDDSKGTNVGATLAAVAGLPGPLILIAGGDGKGQEFAPLSEAFSGKVRHVVLIGRDAPALERALTGTCVTSRAASMHEAVAAAASRGRAGDTVLLSPACSSLDMFRDYGHRGDVFAAAVRELATGELAGQTP